MTWLRIIALGLVLGAAPTAQVAHAGGGTRVRAEAHPPPSAFRSAVSRTPAFARTPEHHAYGRMLDLIWKTRVGRPSARSRSGLLSVGFAARVWRRGNRAVKQLFPEFDSRMGWKLDRSTVRRLFEQEVAVHRRVNEIAPKLAPRLLDVQRAQLQFSMEFVRGKSLANATWADLKPGALHRFVDRVLALHRAGIAHGDIKPENILVANGELKLLDWGAGRPPLDAGGIETAMDRYLKINMGVEGPVDLVAFDRLALARIAPFLRHASIR